jgi:hypothetical protein
MILPLCSIVLDKLPFANAYWVETQYRWGVNMIDHRDFLIQDFTCKDDYLSCSPLCLMLANEL